MPVTMVEIFLLIYLSPKNMNVSPLSNLSVEIIVRLFSFLLPKELAQCAHLSKRFLTIIRTTSILTYALELGKVNLDGTYFLNFQRIENSECNSSDLLAVLRKREHGLSTFTWNERWDTFVKKKFNNLQICGSVFTGGYAHKDDEWYHVDTIYVYDLHNVSNNGPTVTTLSLNAVYSGYAVDPGQDLLVLIENYVVGDPFYKLHFHTLSTGLEYEYTTLKQSVISVWLPYADGWSSQPLIDIFGDNLLVKQHNSKSSDMKIINWKTAQTLFR
ncbi:hypothetical protein Clacol_005725 [Clathrus columnatus]|uniref:F-box domain-containing protein n=1 Tax=Clathrus columnatus TaxID=1419009 RepID=A0AAV5AA45_9AGAM|nr:hypothetical protein Clacol_005725 [Clathrus columnatus]